MAPTSAVATLSGRKGSWLRVLRLAQALALAHTDCAWRSVGAQRRHLCYPILSRTSIYQSPSVEVVAVAMRHPCSVFAAAQVAHMRMGLRMAAAHCGC